MKKQHWTLVLAGVLLSAAVFCGYQRWGATKGAPREELLALLPSDASAVIFLDLEELRRAPFMAKLYEWAPKPESDADYAQFLKDTGFDYERDLHRIAFATKKKGQDSVIFAIADGKFDRAKISAYASRSGSVAKNGEYEVYSVPATGAAKKISFVLLKNDRIALTDDADLSALLNSKNRKEDTAEWRTRFERLAGSPVFAVIRQDAGAGSALAAQAPGGLRSPQLSTLLDQLQWITLAGKPDNRRDCPSACRSLEWRGDPGASGPERFENQATARSRGARGLSGIAAEHGGFETGSRRHQVRSTGSGDYAEIPGGSSHGNAVAAGRHSGQASPAKRYHPQKGAHLVALI